MRQKLELNRKKKHGTVAKLRLLSPKIESGLLGENQGYPPRKRAYFWMKLVFYWGRLELMLVHNRGQEYAH